MAFKAERKNVGTTAMLLAGPDPDGANVALRNRGAASVDLGPSTVATGAGYELAAGDRVDNLRLSPGEQLHAVAAAGTVRVDVLTGGSP